MNILTSANSHYMPFAKIFFTSLSKLDDYNQINTIYVIDSGLTEYDRSIIQALTDKVDFVEGELKSFEPAAIHSEEWVALVSNKTKTFLNLLRKGITPLLFVDIDCYFKEDFFNLVDSESDLVLCQRKRPEFNRYHYQLTHIGSFFGVNQHSHEVERFIERWINEMLTINGSPRETPGLCETLRKYRFDLKISNIQEDLVSCHTKDLDVKKFDECKIFHMKSTGPTKHLSPINSRIERLSRYIDIDKLL